MANFFTERLQGAGPGGPGAPLDNPYFDAEEPEEQLEEERGFDGGERDEPEPSRPDPEPEPAEDPPQPREASPPQQPQQPGFSEDRLAHAISTALIQAEEYRRRADQLSREPEIPDLELSAEERKRLLDDEDALAKTLNDVHRRGARLAMDQTSEVRRELGQSINGISQFLGRMRGPMETVIRDHAAREAVRAGWVTEDKVDDVMARADQAMSGVNDPSMRLDPRGWAGAVRYVLSEMPVRRPNQQPEGVGSGDPPPKKGGGAKPEILKQMESALGTEFDDDDVEAFNQRTGA